MSAALTVISAVAGWLWVGAAAYFVERYHWTDDHGWDWDTDDRSEALPMVLVGPIYLLSVILIVIACRSDERRTSKSKHPARVLKPGRSAR